MTGEEKPAAETDPFEEWWNDFAVKSPANDAMFTFPQALIFKDACREAFEAGDTCGYERAYDMCQRGQL